MPATLPAPLQIRALGAMACGLLSAFLALFYVAARTGFGVSIPSVAGVLGLAWCLIALPFGIHTLLELRGIRLRWYQREGFFTLIVIGLTALLGTATAPVGRNANWILFIAGFIAFVWTIRESFRGLRRRFAVVVTLCVFFYAIWLAGVEWANGYLSPLFVENLILRGGDGHVDTLFFASLGNMLNTYGVPSTGWDGVPYTAYHFGSAWLFAQWGNLVDLSVLDFYQLGAAVVLIPLFLRAMLIFAAETAEKFFSRGENTPGRVFGVLGGVIVCGTIGFLPPSALNSAAVWGAGPFLSESYVMALALAMLAFSLAASFGSDWIRQDWSLKGQSRLGMAAFALLFLPVAAGAIGMTKVSIMLLILAAGLYLILRLRFYRVRLFLLGAGLVVIVSLYVYSVVVWSGLIQTLLPLSFLRYAVDQTWWPFFFVLHFFWTWLYMFLRVKQEGAETVGDVVALVRSRRILDVELALVFAFMGSLPGLLFDTRSDAYYFSDVQRWFSLALLLSNPSLVLKYIARRQPAKSFGQIRVDGFVARTGVLVVVSTILITIAAWGILVVHKNFATRRALQEIAGTRPTTSVAGDVLRLAIRPSAWFNGGLQDFLRTQLKPLADSAAFAKGLQTRDRYPVVNALLEISSIPSEERRTSLIHIDPMLDRYWKFLSLPGACQFSVMVGPALSGTALLDGVPAGCVLDGFYGSEAYPAKPADAGKLSSDNPALCGRARKLGFSMVIRVQPAEGNRVRVLRLSCLNRGARVVPPSA